MRFALLVCVAIAAVLIVVRLVLTADPFPLLLLRRKRDVGDRRSVLAAFVTCVVT
jgi:hypothetical protein